MRAEPLLGKGAGTGWLTPVPVPRPPDVSPSEAAVVVAAPTEEPRMDSETYVHLLPGTRVRVRGGAMPTLQIDDQDGHALSVNATNGQLRQIAETITEYLTEQGAARVWTTEEILRNAG